MSKIQNVNVQGSTFGYAGPVGKGRSSRKSPESFSGAAPPVSFNAIINNKIINNIHAPAANDSRLSRLRRPHGFTAYLLAVLLAFAISLAITGCDNGTAQNQFVPTPAGTGTGSQPVEIDYENPPIQVEDIQFPPVPADITQDEVIPLVRDYFISSGGKKGKFVEQGLYIMAECGNIKGRLERQGNLDATREQLQMVNTAYNKERDVVNKLTVLKENMAGSVQLAEEKMYENKGLLDTLSYHFNNDDKAKFKAIVEAFQKAVRTEQRVHIDSSARSTQIEEINALMATAGLRQESNLGSAIRSLKIEINKMLLNEKNLDKTLAPNFTKQFEDISQCRGMMEDILALGLYAVYDQATLNQLLARDEQWREFAANHPEGWTEDDERISIRYGYDLPCFKSHKFWYNGEYIMTKPAAAQGSETTRTSLQEAAH